MEWPFDFGSLFNAFLALVLVLSGFRFPFSHSTLALVLSGFRFPFLLHLISQGTPIFHNVFFFSDSTIGLGGSDSRGSIEQPIIDKEVISIDGSSSKDTR